MDTVSVVRFICCVIINVTKVKMPNVEKINTCVFVKKIALFFYLNCSENIYFLNNVEKERERENILFAN